MKKYLVMIICLFVISVNACYMQKMAYYVKKDTVGHFNVLDTPIDVAFSKATETVIEQGMTISSSDKGNNSFIAIYPGTMFGGVVTTMNFILIKESETSLKCTISIRSSKGNQTAIDEFKAGYGKKVKISG